MSVLAESLKQAFERHHADMPGGSDPAIAECRRAAFAAYESLGLPTIKQESWKYTDITRLKSTEYVPSTVPDATAAGFTIDSLPVPSFTPHLAVFIDGFFRQDLSDLNGLPAGITVSRIATLANESPDQFAELLNPTDAPFAALNAAFLSDGVVVNIDAEIDEPLHIIFAGTGVGDRQLTTARIQINAGKHSRATIIETHCSLDGASNTTNALTNINADDGAVVKHYRIQADAPVSHHIGNVKAIIAKDAAVETNSFAFGGGITRIDVDAHLVGHGAFATLNGLFMANDDQHIDHHTRIHHMVSHTASEENYKGIADGNGRGVFNGKIFVAQDAQKITANQSSKNLLLADGAEIDTKPELEIYADDVKCAHGATVGQLDEDSFFYLRSRGIDEDTARSILTFAFAADIAAGVDVDELRIWLEQRIMARTHTTNINEIEHRE